MSIHVTASKGWHQRGKGNCILFWRSFPASNKYCENSVFFFVGRGTEVHVNLIAFLPEQISVISCLSQVCNVWVSHILLELLNPSIAWNLSSVFKLSFNWTLFSSFLSTIATGKTLLLKTSNTLLARHRSISNWLAKVLPVGLCQEICRLLSRKKLDLGC